MDARAAELLPVPYFHVVFTLPAAIGDIAYQNKAVIYDLLFKVSAETMTTIAADPRHLGARIGITSVLHTWGTAMTHHPHVHMIVPGGGIALDGSAPVAVGNRRRTERDGSRSGPTSSCRCGCSRGCSDACMIERLAAAHAAGLLNFHGTLAHLADAEAFAAYPGAAEEDPLVRLCQAPVRRTRGGARLSLALHPPRRDLEPAADRDRRQTIHLQVKDYRIEGDGATRP